LVEYFDVSIFNVIMKDTTSARDPAPIAAKFINLGAVVKRDESLITVIPG
jgi:hypothetical protein